MQRVGTLLVVALVGALAHAEGVDSEMQMASTRQRLTSADTVLPVAGGLVSVGGETLRELAPGSQRWKALHQLRGDNLYRVAGDASGRLLAAWEKDPFIHYFTAGPKRRHFQFPKPVVASPSHRAYHLQSLHFLPNGRDALVLMSGSLVGISVRWSTAAYRVALDGKSAPELLFQEEGSYLLHAFGNAVVFSRPKDPKQDCDYRDCEPMAGIIAYDLSGDSVIERPLLTSEQVPMYVARPVQGSTPERVVVILGLKSRERALLRWRPGDATAGYRTLPKGDLDAVSLVTRTDEFIELEPRGNKMKELELDVKRYPPEGGERVVTVPPLQMVDSRPHDMGERKDGTLWLHWGDHLILLGPGKSVRSFSLEPLLERKTEWAGVDVYIERPESLWVGLDGRGRNFARVSFAEVGKRAKSFPAAK